MTKNNMLKIDLIGQFITHNWCEIPNDITLEFLYKEIKTDIVECVYLDNNIVIIVDEIGLLKPNFVTDLMVQESSFHLAGPLCFVGTDDNGFVPLTNDQALWLSQQLKYCALPYGFTK